MKKSVFIYFSLFILVIVILSANLFAVNNLSNSDLNNSEENSSVNFCNYNNQTYHIGQSFSSTDGCNTCSCGGNNTISCTKMICRNLTNTPNFTNVNVTCKYEMVEYNSGDSWKKGDGCNICSCSEKGRMVCTKRLCINKTEIKENVRSRIKENCERPYSRQDRILCRLKEYKYGNYTFNESVIPEACRNETYKERCKSFYAKIRPCYTKEGEAKLACFRRLAGLSNSALNGQGVKKEEMRNYVVALLYDLEQRVEKLNEVDKISNDNAAIMIDLITRMKQKILEGSNASEVHPLMQELKQMWHDSKASASEKEMEDDYESDDGENNQTISDNTSSNESLTNVTQDDTNANLTQGDNDNDTNLTEDNSTGENNTNG